MSSLGTLGSLGTLVTLVLSWDPKPFISTFLYQKKATLNAVLLKPDKNCFERHIGL